ncbi:MAG: glucose-1-phosphate adenylyltransferase [Pseudomonadota bacterium]|nr:glucose-1-phosphate adenylyltransferase [Pseudomonadota bacterium]
MEDVLAIILAGGTGNRLSPLTLERAKPAVPFGGKYRIIDFTLANCLHSGLRRILVLTQYKSHSLQKHLRDGWSIFNPELGEYITPVPPQMRTGDKWYSGTADAIYQNLYLLERASAENVIILSGDHIYRMDYAEMLHFHEQKKSDVTIASMSVALNEACHFGILSVNKKDAVAAFSEKPATPVTQPGNPDSALASMGIYIFKRELLIDTLRKDADDDTSTHDFGTDILPSLLNEASVFSYQFGGKSGRVSQDRYWRDVGTIDAYYEANMALLEPEPPMDLYQMDWNIRTYEAQHPPARTIPGKSGHEGIFLNSIVSGGVVIIGAGVGHSILFPRVHIDEDALVSDSILFEGVKVGSAAQLNHCIIDKGVEVPPGTIIGQDPEEDARRFTVSPGGIVVVPKNYIFEES